MVYLCGVQRLNGYALFIEQISVGAGTRQMQIFSVNQVQKQPIRLYVGIPMRFP